MPRTPLRTALSTPASKRQYVRQLFSTIADRYDLITRILSYGRDRHWKKKLATLACRAGSADGVRGSNGVAVLTGMRALDLACGTGDIASRLRAGGAHVVGLDITHRMLELAAARLPDVPFVTADMLALPFGDQGFDVVTTGYGLRNVPDLRTAIGEIARVLKPGGMLLSLDFNRPAHPFVRGVYLLYLTIVGSALGLVLHGDPDTYRYIPESIRRYPGAQAVNEMIRGAGFSSSEYIPVLGGLMAIHRATREGNGGDGAHSTMSSARWS
jgi:demethylmenaquinone methyltransferase/2-methoxy-6-polyprenyl-1,4-benzoquinol methylase